MWPGGCWPGGRVGIPSARGPLAGARPKIRTLPAASRAGRSAAGDFRADPQGEFSDERGPPRAARILPAALASSSHRRSRTSTQPDVDGTLGPEASGRAAGLSRPPTGPTRMGSRAGSGPSRSRPEREALIVRRGPEGEPPSLKRSAPAAPAAGARIGGSHTTNSCPPPSRSLSRLEEGVPSKRPRASRGRVRVVRVPLIAGAGARSGRSVDVASHYGVPLKPLAVDRVPKDGS
jgi:hypothetical protein